jgi:hypothetical protein
MGRANHFIINDLGDTLMEQWKFVKAGNSEIFEISSEGRIRNSSGQIIKCRLNSGYPHFTRNLDGERFIHRIVAKTFIGPIPKKYHVNHKNGNRSDNRVENLEIVTASENNLHLFHVLGREAAKGETHPTAKYSEEMIREIRWLFAMGARQFMLAKEYMLDPTVIRDIVHRYTWKHL